MLATQTDLFVELVLNTVLSNDQICIAPDEHLNYIALNKPASAYLNIQPEALPGKCALQVFPEIIASRNHRNILRALTGIFIETDLVESRQGDILKTSYTPICIDQQVKAVILEATLH
jgi:hypothetical protein